MYWSMKGTTAEGVLKFVTCDRCYEPNAWWDKRELQCRSEPQPSHEAKGIWLDFASETNAKWKRGEMWNWPTGARWNKTVMEETRTVNKTLQDLVVPAKGCGCWILTLKKSLTSFYHIYITLCTALKIKYPLCMINLHFLKEIAVLAWQQENSIDSLGIVCFCLNEMLHQRNYAFQLLFSWS